MTTAAQKKPIIDDELLISLDSNALYDLQKKIREQTREREEERMRAAVADHTALVGKCFKVRVKPHSGMFPEMWRYYKIINARADNEYFISVLRFDEYPTYWFDYHNSKVGHAGDYYFGQYDFDGITVEDFPYYYYNSKNNFFGENLIEITLEEYNAAMNWYVKRLQDLEWPADHYRWGDRKPGDPDWKREEDK